MAANAIVLDSGALSSLAQKRGRLRDAIKEAIADGSAVLLPTIVLAETTTGIGPRDAPVNLVAKACVLEELDERIARAAAALRFLVPGSGVADAVVIATADAHPGSIVLTGDMRDLRALASVRGLTAVVAI